MCGKKMHKTIRGAVAATWALLSVQACADTRFVSPDGSDEYPYLTPETAARTIQAAVDAAEPGDTVEVLAGEYLEQVQLKERLCLRGAGPGLTTIGKPFPGAHYVILAGQDARIQDLSVIHRGPPMQPARSGILLLDAPNQVVDNCSVSGPFDVGIACGGPVVGAPAVVVRSRVSGAGIGVRCDGFAVLDRCTLEGNTWGAWTGYADVLISGCNFVGNTVGIFPWYTQLTVQSTRFVGGEAAISQDEDYFVHLTMVTSLISGAGTAFNLLDSGELTLLNCTLSNNDVVFRLHMETVDLVNCIFWGNKTLVDTGFQGNMTARHSDIQGGWEGEGNIDADPRFLGPEAGDFRLRPDSPCIDAGTTSRPGLPPLQGPSRDLEGKRMPAYGGRTEDLYAYPDMGAYEYYLFTVRRDEETGHPALIWASFYYYAITYAIWYSDDLSTWQLADPKVTAHDDPFTSWIDDGSKTGVPPSLVPRRFYRLLENP